ncbi:MAG TPA: MBL fold metallo-hydrolase [Acidimicrobiales bacterium]|nr:MBL fold metallo-hydrolase [Acidimicrobiales bacterium]
MLLLDAGTGIRNVSRLLDGRPFDGSILLGHLHWDHTQGLPFFRSGDDPAARVDLYMPAQGDPEAVLERTMSPPHFPITPSQLRGNWHFHTLEEGQSQIEGFSVSAREVPHKGGRTFGLRVSDGTSTLCYLSDHRPTAVGPGPGGLGEYHDAAMDLARDCDVLFHDAQYTDEELGGRECLGHASVGYALGLAAAAGARRLLLYHHDPPRTDEEIDAIVAAYTGGGTVVEAAAEGMVVDLP